MNNDVNNGMPNDNLNNMPNNEMTEVNQAINTKFHSEPVYQDNTSTIEEVKEEKPKKKLLPLVVILLLAVLLVGGYFVYTILFAKPYKKAINSMYKNFQANNMLGDYYKVTSTASVSADSGEFAALDGVSVTMTTQIDQKNEKMLLNVNYSESNKKVLDFDAFFDNSKVYLDLKDLFDKKIYIDISEATNNTKYEAEDIIYLSKVFIRMLDASLKDEKVTKSNVTIKLNGKDENLKANTYTINKDNYKRVMGNALDVLINDSKAISLLAKYSNEDEKELKNELEEARGELRTYDYNDVGEYSFTIYTKGFLNNYVGCGFVASDELKMDSYEIDGYSLMKLVISEARIEIEGKDTKTIKLISGDQEINLGSITKYSDNDYAITVDIPDTVKLKMTVKREKLSSFVEPNVSNAINIENMTEEDSEKLMTNLEKSLADSKLYQILMGSLPTTDMYEQAQTNSFATEAKVIYQTAQQTWITDSMLESGAKEYSSVKNCGKALDISGANYINYYVQIDKTGKVVKLLATDDVYYIKYNDGANELKIEKINDSLVHALVDEFATKATVGCGTMKIE